MEVLFISTFDSQQFPNILGLCRWHSWKSLSPLKTFLTLSSTIETDCCKNNSFGTNSLAVLQQYVNRNTSAQIHWQCYKNSSTEIHQCKDIETVGMIYRQKYANKNKYIVNVAKRFQTKIHQRREIKKII